MNRLLLAFAFLGASLSFASAAPSAVIRNSVAVCDPNAPGSCMAPTSGGIKSGTYSSAGAGQYALAVNTATNLTPPTGATIAEICVEGQAIRYRDDGTAPTASVGIPVPASSCFQYAVGLSGIQFIGQTSGATLDVSYYK